ncbi:MAG: S24/S26 family peptidase [Solirubrobacteraceae bacterium]
MSATISARLGDRAAAVRGPVTRLGAIVCVLLGAWLGRRIPRVSRFVASRMRMRGFRAPGSRSRAPDPGLLELPAAGTAPSPPTRLLELPAASGSPSSLPPALRLRGEAVTPYGGAVAQRCGEAVPRLRIEAVIIGRRARNHGGSLRRAIVWVPTIVCVLVAVSIGAWVLRGGSVLVMQTPSMGTVAPVGSFVLIHPIGDAPVHKGMIVAFRVPQTGIVYMHRVAEVLPDGSFRTRGDLDSADDGWVLPRAAIVGAPSLILPWLGWVLMGAPWGLGVLVAGLLFAWLLPRSARSAIHSLTFAGCLALPLDKLRPLVRVTIATAGSAGHQVVANLVDSGVLPLRVTLRSSVLLLRPGHLGTISARVATHKQSMAMLGAHPALPLWGWGLLAGVVLTPLAIGLVGLPESDQRSGAAAIATARPAITELCVKQ